MQQKKSEKEEANEKEQCAWLKTLNKEFKDINDSKKENNVKNHVKINYL